MEIKITVNIPAMEQLADAIHVFASALAYTKQGQVLDFSQIEEVKKEVEASDKADKPTTEPSTEDVKPKVTEVELRAKFVELSKKGKKSELKDLLTELGVEKVSDLKPEQFDVAMARLEEM